MFIRSATGAPSGSTPGDILCPLSYPECDPALSAGPALTNINAESFNPNATAVTPAAVPQAALAASIQRLGRRNFVGIIVLAVFVFVGLVLWLSFGKWPRAGLRRVRERLGRGNKQLAKSGSGGSVHGGSEAADLASSERGGPNEPRTILVGQPRLPPLNEKEEDKPVHADYPNSPRSMEVEVESLEKRPAEIPRRKGLHVHFA
ncbi:hypothetical protein ONZ51_g1478 [Trametes cubensis]|uniref:Uncharacterized protein n=1 Tax=Trametes cubensis TaxID=1111947 RepID=A0AAD7XFR7_9APHY|nr:hypothetical protein ONZ51_g1478 [Trametes cubensis]